MKKDIIPGHHIISRDPFPASRKIYVQGDLHEIRVAMREISMDATRDSFNNTVTPNPPVTVYDTSGPYTDPAVGINVREGLPRIREQWIIDRADTSQLPSISSAYGKQRLADGSLDSLRFGHLHTPRKAHGGSIVTQLHYARKGIITPE